LKGPKRPTDPEVAAETQRLIAGVESLTFATVVAASQAPLTAARKPPIELPPFMRTSPSQPLPILPRDPSVATLHPSGPHCPASKAPVQAAESLTLLQSPTVDQPVPPAIPESTVLAKDHNGSATTDTAARHETDEEARGREYAAAARRRYRIMRQRLRESGGDAGWEDDSNGAGHGHEPHTGFAVPVSHPSRRPLAPLDAVQARALANSNVAAKCPVTACPVFQSLNDNVPVCRAPPTRLPVTHHNRQTAALFHKLGAMPRHHRAS